MVVALASAPLLITYFTGTADTHQKKTGKFFGLDPLLCSSRKRILVTSECYAFVRQLPGSRSSYIAIMIIMAQSYTSISYALKYEIGTFSPEMSAHLELFEIAAFLPTLYGVLYAHCSHMRVLCCRIMWCYTRLCLYVIVKYHSCCHTQDFDIFYFFSSVL